MTDLFARPVEEIVAEAISTFNPVRIYAGFSGGNDSLALCHWMMANVPECELFHIITGIGVRATTEFALDTAASYRWPVTVIRSLEDCGEDYDAWVRKHGFPGPHMHNHMFNQLKGRAVELLVRRAKTKRMDKILLATGVREDESIRRMGYKGREINRRGAQVWVSPIYWWPTWQRDQYLMENQIRRNPVTAQLGISGECLCGAFAHPGELERVRAIDPEVAARIDGLHDEIKHRFPWGWEGSPPRSDKRPRREPGPLCIGCEKSAIVQAELAEFPL